MARRSTEKLNSFQSKVSYRKKKVITAVTIVSAEAKCGKIESDKEFGQVRAQLKPKSLCNVVSLKWRKIAMVRERSALASE